MNGIGNEIAFSTFAARPHGSKPPMRARSARAGPEVRPVHGSPRPPPATPLPPMKIFNIDGSLSAACGNGTRCVGWELMRDSDARELMLEIGRRPPAM